MAKVMISMPDELLSQIDQVAKLLHRKRSEFFKEIAVDFLNQIKKSKEFDDLMAASQTSQDFWDNSEDDEVWNDA